MYIITTFPLQIKERIMTVVSLKFEPAVLYLSS